MARRKLHHTFIRLCKFKERHLSVLVWQRLPAGMMSHDFTCPPHVSLILWFWPYMSLYERAEIKHCGTAPGAWSNISLVGLLKWQKRTLVSRKTVLLERACRCLMWTRFNRFPSNKNSLTSWRGLCAAAKLRVRIFPTGPQSAVKRRRPHNVVSSLCIKPWLDFVDKLSTPFFKWLNSFWLNVKGAKADTKLIMIKT